MKNTLLSGAIAALLAGPAMAQTATLDDIQKEIAEMKAKNERLEAEVEYLKENAKAERKDIANKSVTLDTLSASASKYTWNGDFRYRGEFITRANDNLPTSDEHTQNRDRIRVRFGVTAKVNDTITAKLQLATNGGTSASPSNDPRSTNQTIGEGWTRKGISIDQAYVDWKATSFMNLQLGKTPLPWATTASYFWDKDITPEGAALKFSQGIFFGGVYYDWLNERSSFVNSGVRSDSKLVAAQFGIKQPIGKTALTAAVGYFDVRNVQNEIVATATGCTPNGTFFNNSANGNTTITSAGCTVLASGFATINAFVQYDFNVGKFPMSAFVDYMKNNDAEINTVVNKKLDDALAVGVTFNKASAAKSWDASLVYEKNAKDSIFGEFVDSDFAAGATDGKGWSIKANYVPATNWTIGATYFINKINYDGVASTATSFDLDYKRLQLDLNYKF